MNDDIDDIESEDDDERELTNLQWDEISAVRNPANDLPGALLMKSKGFHTRQDIWSRIQREADDAINDNDLTIEQKIAQWLGTPAGRKLYEEWKRAPLAAPDRGVAVTKDRDDLTLAEAAWSAIEKRAVGLTEVRPATPMHDAVAEVLRGDEGSVLYTAYRHPRYAHRPLAEVREQIRKTASGEASLRRALGIIHST